MAGFLNKRLSEVERNYRMMQKQLEKMHLPEVEGWLEINKKKRGFHYYHCLYDTKKKKTIRKYIPTTDLSLAKTLASTTYYKKLQHLLEERILLLHRLNLTFREDEIDRLYDDLHDVRKGLFSPLQPTKQQVLAQWIQQPYFPNPMPKSSTEMKTKRGEIVRSKTEKYWQICFMTPEFHINTNVRYGFGKSSLFIPTLLFWILRPWRKFIGNISGAWMIRIMRIAR